MTHIPTEDDDNVAIWDAWNRLVSLTKAPNGSLGSYSNDGLIRRIALNALKQA